MVTNLSDAIGIVETKIGILEKQLPDVLTQWSLDNSQAANAIIENQLQILKTLRPILTQAQKDIMIELISKPLT